MVLDQQANPNGDSVRWLKMSGTVDIIDVIDVELHYFLLEMKTILDKHISDSSLKDKLYKEILDLAIRCARELQKFACTQLQ